ncbi:unnamed protein product [Lymnaea stagnalis]|uniref:FYVE-type domain-containing protein n=1 Tax=Lymnaea stagnalis TaxID=6523 RepID=A0AAV2H5S9_LYMST
METKSTLEKVLKHHTDTEWRSKIDDLFKFFCNHVFLGQWELARTAIPTLLKEFDKDERNTTFIDILKAVIDYPFSQSLGSPSLKSAHHLSWLCLHELRLVEQDVISDKVKWFDQMTKDIDFRLTLTCLKEADKTVIQELYTFFKKHVLKVGTMSTEKDSTRNDFLSAGAVTLIKQTMVISPSLGDSVVKALVCEEENVEKRHNEMLQALYIECMNSLLDKIQQDSQDEDPEYLCDKLLEILSFYNPVPYWNYLQLRQLFTRLLSLSTEHSACHMTPEKIVSAITGRKSFYLLDEFCKIFQEVSLHTTYKPADEPSNPLNDDQRVVLEIMTKLDRSVCWRDFFILCLKKRVHFLAEILDLSLSLVKAGQFMELQDLLSYPELQPLKSAVLLMGWSHCVTSAHARTLLDTLWDDSNDIHNPVLAKTCRKLAYHLDLIQWCLDRAKPLLQNAEISPTRQATELLQGLETHSVLYMLHHSTSLASLDHSEVLQLLAHVSTDKKTKRKTVTFQDESQSGPQSTINIEQQKDLAIFRSYCAIKNVMDAVAFCAKYFDHKLMSPVHITRTVKAKSLDRQFLPDQPMSSSEGEDSSSPSLHQARALSRDPEEKESSDHFIRSYEMCVTKKLKETKDHLSRLQPLTYRLEILENIFSLIFTTHEDLCDVTGTIDVETDDDVDDSKLNSFGDNLNMSVISEEEYATENTGLEESKPVERTSRTSQRCHRPQAGRSECLDYDAPFIDPYQKQVADPSPVYDVLQSSYFTPGADHQRKATELAQQAQNIYLESKKKRKRKRVTSESCPNTLVGFLPNEYLVRDVLYLLKEALSDLNAAKFTINGKAPEKLPKDPMKSPKLKLPGADPKLESALQASLQSSVQPDMFLKRSTKLTQAVHEAWWRFQLIAHEAIPREPCHVLAERIFITDNDINFLPVCEGTAYSPDKGDSSRLPGTDSDPGSASRPRSASSYTVLSHTNIVSQMMATPESLLVHSLVKGSLTQAAEVIKLFRLTEKTAESCEVLFANVYQTSARLIWELETETKDGAKNPPKVGKRSMKALSKAAAVGVATASLSNIIEDLVSKACVPPVPRPKTAFARENFWHFFNLDSTSALLLDLLCTACRTWDTCANMLDIIKTRTKLLEHTPSHSGTNNSPSASSLLGQSSNPSSGSSSSSVTSPMTNQPVSLPGGKQSLHGVKGCNQLVWCLYDLIQLGESRPHGHLSPISLQHHLHSAYSSLSVQNLRSLDAALMEIRRAVDHVQQIFLGSATGHLEITVEDAGSSASLSPKGSSSSLSGSTTGSAVVGSKAAVKQPIDENPLHVGVKHLMYIMEKYSPGAGLTQLLHVKSSSPFKNYLLSLYKHVKEMTHLVAECQGKNKELTSNYFKVLEDGPVNILGRLLFVKKMPPARLEAVAEKLSLNLTHTIVYSCCPKIPSKHPPSITQLANDTSVIMGSTRAYNLQPDGHLKAADESSPDLADQPKNNPEEIVRDILTELVTIMEGISSQQSAKGVFDLTCAKHLVQMKVYTPLMARVSNLRDVDLSVLSSNDQRLCFMVNLTNLMLLHCHLTCVSNRMELQRQLDELGNGDEEEVDLYPLTAADNLAYLSSFSYIVGQLGIVSVFDLLTILEQDELQSSSQWGNLLAFRKLALNPDDPWKRFAPLPEARTLFLINTGCTSSPPLKILRPDTVIQQLEQSVRDYLVHSVLVSVEKERVSFPELLVWNERRLTSDEPASSTSRHTALLTWVSDFIGAEKQKQLQQLLKLDGVHGENIDVTGRSELPFHVDVASYDSTFSVTFDINHVKVGQLNDINTPVVKNKPKAAVYPFTNSYERSGQGWSLELPIYNLTPVTLEYVKQDSLLVATMVSLTCADNLDNIEQQFTDDHFNQPESTVSGQYQVTTIRPQRSSSDISLVDIRSYRYHRLTDDYPVLQRHLLHYILPLAGADNSELLESREPILKFVTNDINDQVKLCMFSLPNSTQFQCVIQDMANRLLEEHKWTEILNILASLPGNVLQDQLHMQVLHDFVLSCWALSVLQKPVLGTKIGNGLRKFYNPALQARTVLTVCHVLPLDLSLDLLDLCMTVLGRGHGLWQAVHNKYQQFRLYKKIKDCVESLNLQLADSPVALFSPSEQHLHKVLEKLSDWKNIAAVCKDNPEDILMVLERSGDFVSAGAWAELHSLNTDIVKQIKERHLYHLLTLENPDTVAAFQLLDNVLSSSPQECLHMCQNLVGSLVHPREIKFILSFMLRYLSKLLPSDDVEDLRLKRIGSKALMHIPARIQPEYNHLISCPHLILEQLLMNMKAELAGQIFEHIKMDFGEIKEPKLRVSADDFNNLLATYANKAIQVNVVQVILHHKNDNFYLPSANPSRSESASSNNSTSLDDVVSSRRFSLKFSISLSVSPTGSAGARHEVGQKTGNKLPGYTGVDGKPFFMPAQPPTQDQWTPDSSTSVCMACKVERFSMFNRRHHCRRCGRVVCATCSSKQSQVFGVMARTCDECWHQMNSDHRSREDHEIYSQRMKERLSGVSVSPAPGTSPGPSPHLAGLLSPERLKRSLTSAIHHVDHSWKLRPDTSYSQQVRSEFYYEQAPSVSLCISLLKQHSSRLEAGKLILQICDNLSTHLVPISPGVPNPEIDYSLIISVMKQLLFHSKLDFLHTSHMEMLGQCDLYLARVDLLQVMVEANYQDLPTIKELTKQDTIRRLRDKLISDERLSLAMEVSTKCGIDPTGVWAAMGFSCLHLGDFQGARDKFAHCLKVLPDKNQISVSQSRLLGEILDFLDALPSNGLTEVQRLLSSPSSICNIQTLLVPSKGEENRVESVPYKECLNYLRTYGSYMDHITFLRQHGYWMKAVQFAADHHCSSDVFVTGLMVPAMTSGEFGHLLEQMLMLDPTLEKWTSYLTATCKYLLKQKYFSTLYQVQLFMKDYIRASMTCITHFYQRGAHSYLDLSGRMQFLFTAQQHLQAYLDPSQWGSVHHPLAPITPVTSTSARQVPSWDKVSPESAARMTLTPEQVNKHIRTINLQIEVTKFLEQCLTQSMGGASAVEPTKLTQGAQIPTLFGQSSSRTELVSMIILSGPTFKAGFDLALRIIRECRLNSTVIFSFCSRELAKQNRFSEISSLTQALIHDGLVDDEAIDEIIGASLLVIADTHTQARDESDSLIQLLRSDSNKINAFILCGKLRSAYLLAVKRDRVMDVQRIAGAAQRLGQTAVKNICKKWLEEHQK